jgi:hypothetical protein
MNDTFSELLCQARLAITRVGFTWRYAPGKPASPRSIDACETALGQKLPEEFRSFLLLRNGLRITIGETQAQSPVSLAFEILDVNELTNLNVRKRDTGEIAEEWHDAIAFAGYGTGDHCAFAPGSAENDRRVIDLAHDRLPGDPHTIVAAGFNDFIGRTLGALARGREPQYWLDNPLRDTEGS